MSYLHARITNTAVIGSYLSYLNYHADRRRTIFRQLIGNAPATLALYVTAEAFTGNPAND